MKRKKDVIKKRIIVSIVIILLIITSFFMWKNEFKKEKKTPSPEVTIPDDAPTPAPEIYDKKLSLIMGGDSLIHSAVYGDAYKNGTYNFLPMLENIRPLIESYDLAYYNQETILGGSALGLSTYPRFNSPYEVGDAFRNLGFNLVSLANNHTLDRGSGAIYNSCTYWYSYKEVLTAGSYLSFEDRNKERIYTKNDISYTMLSYTDTTNGIKVPTGEEYLVNVYDEAQVKQDVEAIKDKVDVLIVAMHFGTEYSTTPNNRQIEIVNYLSSLGVNIIIGTHPHVIQPMQMINDTLVIYSLGNLISAQRGIDRLSGLLATVTIHKTKENGEVKISLEDIGASLIYTDSVITNSGRYGFKLYRYQDLTDEILPNYKEYYQKYINIIESYGLTVEKLDNML